MSFLNSKQQEILLNMVQLQKRVEQLTNEELAQLLVDSTENVNMGTTRYQMLMEAAYRLAPTIFEES